MGEPQDLEFETFTDDQGTSYEFEVLLGPNDIVEIYAPDGTVVSTFTNSTGDASLDEIIAWHERHDLRVRVVRGPLPSDW